LNVNLKIFLNIVLVGISALFVFGFAVYNVAPTPRNLDWCFYVNLVAVILSCIGALLLTIYAFLVKKPIKYICFKNFTLNIFLFSVL
jgi:hypothetical protein